MASSNNCKYGIVICIDFIKMQATTSNLPNVQVIGKKVHHYHEPESITKGIYSFTWTESGEIYLDDWIFHANKYTRDLLTNNPVHSVQDNYQAQANIIDHNAQIDKYKDVWTNFEQINNHHLYTRLGEGGSKYKDKYFPQVSFETMLSSLKFDNFKVIGNRIYDPNGQEFIAKGINVFTWDRGYDIYLKNWGFNTIRVPNYLLGSYNQPHPASDNYQTNHKIVDVYTSQGAVVIFDAHDRIGGYYEGNQWEILKDYWREMARQFKDNPYVWFNLHNEPGDSKAQPQKWVEYHRQLIDIIRGEGAKNLIIVDGEAWGQDYHTRTIASDAHNIMAGNENIVFSIHVYDQWMNQNIGAYFDQLQAQDIPIMVGEYGSENVGQNVTQASVNMMLAAQSREIGRIAWVGQANDNNDLTYGKGGHAYYFNGTNTEILTRLGSLVWQDLQHAEDLGYADHHFWTRFTSPEQATQAATQGIYNIVITDVSGNKNFASQSQLSIFISGDTGNNKFQGGDQDDVLIGKAGADKLTGQNGNDLLVGGQGNDELTGGSGNDVFYIDGKDGGKDIITDFNPENDALYINNILPVAQAWTANGFDKTSRYGHLGALRITNLKELTDLSNLLNNLGGSFGAYTSKNQNQLILDFGETMVQLNGLAADVHIF